MAVVREGKNALTEFQVIEQDFIGDQALVKCKIHTGRTHQIRVHLAFVGAPVVGDSIYGYRKQRIKMKRLFLHATRLQFEHPITEEEMVFESPLPVGLQNILEKLRR
jgi:23S rRNA pseudouridine1911/1915/1917 synthase